MSSPEKYIINPIALKNCFVKIGDKKYRIIDLSFIRLLIESDQDLNFNENDIVTVELQLDRIHFTTKVTVKSIGQDWIRFCFGFLIHSHQAHLRAFMSPKKMGESLLVDHKDDKQMHFHGLNESELWVDMSEGILFTYLEKSDGSEQFIIGVDKDSKMRAGIIDRQNYIDIKKFSIELPLKPLNEKEAYLKLSECRDIVTNFRPVGQIEYLIKQKLLKVISDQLYTTVGKINFTTPQAPKIVTLVTEN